MTKFIIVIGYLLSTSLFAGEGLVCKVVNIDFPESQKFKLSEATTRLVKDCKPGTLSMTTVPRRKNVDVDGNEVSVDMTRLLYCCETK